MKPIPAFALLSAAAFVVSCGPGNRPSAADPADAVTDAAAEQPCGVRSIDPLPAGVLTLNDDDFGPTIPLEGRNIATDDLFSVSDVEMTVKDSLLLLKSQQNDGAPLRVYSLPDFRLLKQVGRFGRGPGEMVYPRLVPYRDRDAVCFLVDGFSNRQVRVTPGLEAEPFELPLTEEQRRNYGFSLVARNAGDILFTSLPDLMRCTAGDTAARTDRILDLAYLKGRHSPTRYIGSLGADFDKGRAVFAYKYDRRIVFADLNEGSARTVVFRGKNDVAEGAGMDDNTTHYWKLSAGSRYVYLLYSGRTPLEVAQEQSRGERYIFVEAFDWNGNPVARYRLDRWGYFCADEARNRIILVSTGDQHPFFVYDLPSK